VALDALIAAIKNEHPELKAPVVQDGISSWRLPTGWVFQTRDEGGSISMAVSKGERPAAWIPTTKTEALGCLRWFLRRKADRA
jgi:hypothetical protein